MICSELQTTEKQLVDNNTKKRGAHLVPESLNSLTLTSKSDGSPLSSTRRAVEKVSIDFNAITIESPSFHHTEGNNRNIFTANPRAGPAKKVAPAWSESPSPRSPPYNVVAHPRSEGILSSSSPNNTAISTVVTNGGSGLMLHQEHPTTVNPLSSSITVKAPPSVIPPRSMMLDLRSIDTSLELRNLKMDGADPNTTTVEVDDGAESDESW